MRKGRPKQRIIEPDPKFKDARLSQFVNNLMLDGKKNLAFKIVYGAFDIIKEKTNEEGLDIFHKAINNACPSVQVKSRRVGGATFQIPTEVSPKRKLSLGMKWIIMFSRKRNGKSMKEKLANELIAAANEEGGAIKKKEDTHRMAEANKAFSHFRF